ncbi:SGNH/GDSL hydrolase family protein [Treponema brennaborense]|uniref:SGNH/GDSL hydrolase family protein n=1 Tax=Treponema brennaborense TaxID=81028 RepID=UPI0005A24B67|nr:SGNH/GDSL hydrolase family protein [Treponema brennaborense]
MIKSKIQNYHQKLVLKNEISESVLRTFNNDIFDDLVNNEFIINPAYETVEFLFLGNSLTYCGMPEEEPDKTRRGLAATKVENDYVHKLIFAYAAKYGVNIRFSVVNIADFERGFVQNPFNEKQLQKVQVKNPDIVIFQIGENVSRDDIIRNGKLFLERYSELVNYFKESRRVVCLPFWPDKEKINVITEVALTTGSIICDLSHLGSGIDSENFASSYKNYKQPGVGAHPGDVGMDRIAKNILSVINQ